MKSLFYALPLGILIATRVFRVEPLAIRIKTVAGPKKRGIDSFGIATTIKNTGDLDLTLTVEQSAVHVNTGRVIPIKTTTNISLPKGSTIRVPPADFHTVLVPTDAPLGIYNAFTKVTFDTRTIGSVLSDAWEVIEPVKAAEIVKIDVR
jgi:hypothetical protein